ncbi:MAG: YicC/YloC family endoribonuclease [Rhodoferax sp.]
MAVYSMTGYASVQSAALHASAGHDAPGAAAAPNLGLEIRSVNSRFLDLSFKFPEELRAHEGALRELLNARLKRGKVELRASIERTSSEALAEPSPKLLQRLGQLQDNVRAWLPDAQALRVVDVLALASHAPTTHGPDWGETLRTLAEQAVQALREARAREGQRLAATLLERSAQLRALAAQALPLVPQLVEQQRQRFLERWKEAMALGEDAVPAASAQERALAEATAFAIRIDVAEELTRLQSHLDEIDRLLTQGGEIGKRMDFLIQELHREANTLGSKSATLELTRISVDMKVLIEQMREQVQNIE